MIKITRKVESWLIFVCCDIKLSRMRHFEKFRGKKLSLIRHFDKFRGKKLSRIRHFETFRGKKLSRKGPKNAKPRKFLPAKVSDLKVLKIG